MSVMIKQSLFKQSLLMMLTSCLIVISIVITLIPSTYAATIKGRVYDLSLEPIDALVEINTVPQQFFVALGGEYQFNVNPGRYVLKANTTEGTAIELIDIIDNGEYNIDIVIGLNIDESSELINDPEITEIIQEFNETENNKKTTYSWLTPSIIGITIMVLLAIIIVFLFISKSNSKISDNYKKNESENEKNNSKNDSKNGIEQIPSIPDIELRTIALIREHSRITQKELRKMLPYSEAKISLIVAQLESEGKIKKIKKGRGNILIYIKG